ncbi:MAG: tetratricopeptide repeat protein, partial [Chloroflexi bacterium]|nr:tetratricopeptide repeat protein [Chloroflexota bacterium]
MADSKAYLARLNNNLNILREREARHGGNAPVELLNQIEDHRTAIALTEQVIRSELAEVEWRETLKPLLVSLNIFGDFFAPPIPWQYPTRATHFTDRERELEKLLADLQPGRVVTLCGPGGIDKSALAAEAVWQLPPSRFPDGVIFHSFYNQPQATLALEQIALSCGEEARPTPRDAARRALSSRQALLLLDGAEDADDLPAVLEVAGSCGVLVTSRKRKDAADERQDIQPLPTGEAVKLLRAWGQEQAADTRAAEQICQLVGRLPLAVRLVGKYLDETDETAAEYLAWLEKTPLEALDQGRRRLESVPVLLQESLAQVSETARQVLGVVGLLALAPFGREPVAAALGLVEGQVRQPLGELVSFGLLLRSGEGYEVSHALIHTYAQERVQPEAEAVRRLAEYYTALAEVESKKGLPGYRRLDAERVHMMQVLAGCAGQGEWAAVQNLVRVVGNYLEIQGYSMEWATALETGVKATRELGHRQDEGGFLGNLGNAYRVLGNIQRAIESYEQAVAIAREIGNRRNEGVFLGNLGLAYRVLGEVQRAIEYHEQALIISREIDDRRAEEAGLSSLGIAYHTLGEVQRAIEHYEQALAIARQLGDRRAEGRDLGNLGLAYRVLGEVQRAIEYHEQA